MTDVTTILATLFGLYVLVMGLFLISENRRPQSTLAWLLAFLVIPGAGLLIYFFFGRDHKAFSKQRELLMQDLGPHATPFLTSLLSRQDAQMTQLENKGSAHKKLMMLVRRNSRSGLTSGSHVQIQQDATKFYPSLMADIEAARHSIHLQYFIWRADVFTERLGKLLAAKAKAGVEVRLLYDPVGSRAPLIWKHLRALRAAGVQVAPTSPLYKLHTISYRNHRKLTIIDGVIGYTGGMNIGQEHLDGGKGFDVWRDTQLRITDQGAALLQAVFAVDWYNAVRENLFSAAYFPQEASAEPSEDGVPMQILTSGPDAQWEAIRQLYALMIVSAQRQVLIQSPYFILDASIAEALKTAAMSGVKVQVMLSARESGNPLPTWAANTYVADVVHAGVQVFHYEKGYLHAKTISIDSKICSIGSANIDIRSFSINYELNAVLYSDRLARELEQAFERDLGHCTEFDLATYYNRSAAVRFRDSAARLFSPLL